jgi:uncharacterized Fe-S cluster-containing radical SAM superfamily protein
MPHHSPSPSLPEDGRSAAKFRDPWVTADGAARAQVQLKALTTLWVNTGTLCNITCAHCYIESSPENDHLVYFSLEDLRGYLDEIAALGLPTEAVAFTGGEPFMNPEMLAMAEEALSRSFGVLVLTNAMRPMMRPRVQEGLKKLGARFGERLTLRVSLDHYEAALHDGERGMQSFCETLRGIKWLAENGFSITIAGRSLWNEPEDSLRAGFASLFEEESIPLDAADRTQLIIFPEMDARLDVPEITTACWSILNKNPDSVMCASSRMVVRRKSAIQPAVLSCTLLPYDEAFELGPTLSEAQGAVPLNHPHCARFCVLGGGSCTG